MKNEKGSVPETSGNYKQPTEVPSANTAGYPQTGIKTSGVKTRGNGAATKGFTARGPLA